MADFGADVDIEAFRGEARAWLEANFPASLKGKAALATGESKSSHPDIVAWRRTLGEKGWSAPTWPKEYGGGGLSAAQARVLGQEMARAGAFHPSMFGMGITMIGPTILDYGTEEQKKKHLPPIIMGEVQWCVGYSEPNAGSDLASLQTRADDVGDSWKINGQNIWTSGAQYSDWCGLLVRTDFSAKKHEGISFLLVDMHQPGIETRPIALISGASPFCETFFTDAVAPKTALLGQINVGWTVGKRLLQHERASQTGGSMGGRGPKPLNEIAKAYLGVDGEGRLADADFRTRLVRHEMDARVHGQTLMRAAAEARGNNSPGNAPSVLKNSATNVAQIRAELTLELMGSQGLGWDGANYSNDEVEAVRSWLWGKAMSIYGGSAEIQNNIISKRILGLPDNTQST
ncbi:MAG: acyl-CoA dehydrogenase family protein [Phenylobacterium sp.]